MLCNLLNKLKLHFSVCDDTDRGVTVQTEGLAGKLSLLYKLYFSTDFDFFTY